LSIDNQLYKTYLQLVEAEVGKRQQRKYPYTIKNPNEFGNSLTLWFHFHPTEPKRRVSNPASTPATGVYALYSNSDAALIAIRISACCTAKRPAELFQ
jgi:hypothetical protein